MPVTGIVLFMTSQGQQTPLCTWKAMTRPVIAVLGATGLQGGAVLTALLKQDEVLVRAVTRNAAKAGDLARKQNAEVVEADMGNTASLTKVGMGMGPSMSGTPHIICCEC